MSANRIIKDFLNLEKYENVYTSKEGLNNLKLNILTRCGEFGKKWLCKLCKNAKSL